MFMAAVAGGVGRGRLGRTTLKMLVRLNLRGWMPLWGRILVAPAMNRPFSRLNAAGMPRERPTPPVLGQR